MRDASPESPKKVLVVDDKPDICEFMHAALESAGYEVRTATEGEEALMLQRARPADLLITDIFMPGREGMETIASFKADFPRIRIIAMSAGGGTRRHDFLVDASLVGADATLHKPFDVQTLLETVGRVLR